MRAGGLVRLEPLKILRIEPDRPVKHNLQRHPTYLCGFTTATSVGDRGQRQLLSNLRGIDTPTGQSAQIRT